MSNEQETVNFSRSNSKGKFQKSTPARPHGANPKAKKETETIACKYCGGKHNKRQAAVSCIWGNLYQLPVKKSLSPRLEAVKEIRFREIHK